MGRLLSVEIDKRNIKIVEVSKKGEVLSILNCFTFKSPLNIAEDKIETDDIDYIASIIKKELDTNDIKTNKAILVINSDSIITRNVKLPLLKKRYEILSMIKNELEQLMSVDLNQYKIIYNVLNKFIEKDAYYAFYAVYCLPVSIYNLYIELSKKLELRLICIDVSFNCLNKIFAHNIKINKRALNLEHVYAFINIDLTWCSFCVLNKGINNFFRVSVYDDITNVETAAEESAYYGLNKPANPSVYMGMWLEEISKYIRYYYSIDNAVGINKIFIYGEGSETKDICEYLSKNLKIDVVKITDVSNIQFGENFAGDFQYYKYFNSILSLYNDKNDISLCRENLNDRKNGLKLPLKMLSIITIIITACCVLIYFNNLSENKINCMNSYIYDEDNIKINLFVEKLKKENLSMENSLKRIKELRNIINEDDFINSQILKEIFDAIPHKTKVTSLTIDRNNTQLLCLSESMEEVTLFIKNLRKIKLIDNLHIPSIEVNPTENMSYSYIVVCKLKDVNNDDK